MSEFKVYSISGAADRPPAVENPSSAKPQLAFFAMLFILGMLLPVGISGPVIVISVVGISLVSFYYLILHTWRNNKGKNPIVRAFSIFAGLLLTYFLVNAIVVAAL